jgi:transcriptional regulator with XRE-family HTH domain
VNTQHQLTDTFAQRLAGLRRAARLKREELAERAGVSADLVQSLEQGRTANPTLRTLLRLAAALGVTVAELVEGVCDHSGGEVDRPGN